MNSSTRRSLKTAIQHFQSLLSRRQEEILNAVRRLEAEQRGLDRERPAEVGDFCIESASREDLFERISHYRRLLQRIEAALRRIEYGTFGECTVCGNEIQPKRLEIMPWTDYCIRCQEDFERSSISRAGWSALQRVQRSR